MASSTIKRVGIVVKPHQPDALKTLCGIVEWLSQRGIELVGGPEIERERIEHETGCAVNVVETEKIPEVVDLMLVLGGNYGGLGYLAEFRIEELYVALESILAESYVVQKRVMLAIELMRGEEQ